MKNVLAMLLVIFSFASCSTSSDTIDLNSSVVFSGTQFIVQNKDTFDYNDAKLEINDKYVLEHINIPAGQIFTVGFLNFADSDGNRFSFAMKPQSFSIWCNLPNEKKGILYATFQ